MKTFLVTVMLFFAMTHLQCQSIPMNNETNEIEYQDVVTLEGETNLNIYNYAKNWMLSTLKSSDNMIQLDDSNKKQLIGNGTIALENRGGVPRMENCMINFKFKIDVKQGKYRFTINQFQHYYIQDGTRTYHSNLKDIRTYFWGEKSLKEKRQNEIRNEVNEKMLLLIENMKTTISNSGSESSDW